MFLFVKSPFPVLPHEQSIFGIYNIGDCRTFCTLVPDCAFYSYDYEGSTGECWAMETCPEVGEPERWRSGELDCVPPEGDA